MSISSRMRNRFPSRAVAGHLLAFSLLLLAPAAGSAQSVSQILEQAWERNEARLARIENLRIQQETMGVSIVLYMVKEMVEGSPVLRPHSVQVAGMGNLGQQSAGDELWTDGKQMYLDWADRWSLDGRGSRGGAPTWRLTLDRFDGVDLGEMIPNQESGQFTPTRMTMELEVDRLVPVFMQFEGTMTEGGETRPFNASFTLSDYREVSGYLHPGLTTIEMDIAGAGVSPEEMAEAREGFEELQRQLEQMPEAQRTMMEQMMGGQIAAMQQMLQGDKVQIEARVTDIQANVTLP